MPSAAACRSSSSGMSPKMERSPGRDCWNISSIRCSILKETRAIVFVFSAGEESLWFDQRDRRVRNERFRVGGSEQPLRVVFGGTVPAHDGIGGGIQSRRIAAHSGGTTSIGVFHELCDAEANGEWRGAESGLAVARGHGEAAGYASVR